MTLSTQPYKGARDFYPEDKRVQNYMFDRMRETCERFGYEEYDAPVLEPTELYLSKGNQEIIDEQTYTFIDRGSRSVTMRTEMTPTVSRMIAGRRQEIGYPARWYSIPNVWRYERMQRGRLREFWQLNVDIFGVEGVEAEHELILLADELMKSYGAKRGMYSIRLNSRVLTKHLFRDYLQLNDTQEELFVRLIDRMHKTDPVSFAAQLEAVLSPSQRENGVLDQLQQLLRVKRISELPVQAKQLPAVMDLLRLVDLLDESGVTNVRFDMTLMRGFDYYTNIVFEVFDESPENNRSMFGGGRYDGLVGMFGVEPIPTVGFGMGDVTLQNFLETHGLLPKLSPVTDAYAVLLGENMYEKSTKAIQSMRDMGLNVAVDMTGRKLEKQFKSAAKMGIEHVIIIGETELSSGQYTVRNLSTGTEQKHGLERIVSIIKDHRRKAGAVHVDENSGDDDLLSL